MLVRTWETESKDAWALRKDLLEFDRCQSVSVPFNFITVTFSGDPDDMIAIVCAVQESFLSDTQQGNGRKKLEDLILMVDWRTDGMCRVSLNLRRKNGKLSLRLGRSLNIPQAHY